MPGKSRQQQQDEEQALADGLGLEGQWNPTFTVRARDLALLGFTNAEIAKALGVAEVSIERFAREKPIFRRALAEGREAADGKVARALYRRATGMTIIEEREQLYKGRTTTLKSKKELPPDTQAAGLWLSNRQRGKWRSATAGDPTAGGFDLAGFVQGLAQLAQAGKKDDAASEAQDIEAEVVSLGKATDEGEQ